MHRWILAGAAVVLALGLGLADASKDDVPGLLASLKKVGKEGADNPDAARAWKALVAKGPDALVPILAAVNDDELVASNWLRSAFDAIAEKAVAENKLPKEPLEKFVLDTKNAGGARRQAYEWLAKIDETTPGRLLPGMLKDPAADLRRDAVELLVKQAQAAAETKDAAKELYQKALTGACDPEQVDVIAKALDKLGEKVDVQKHFGVVATWHLIAPFEHTKKTGWDIAYPPEKGIDLAATYEGKDKKTAKWVEHTTKDPQGVVDINKALGKTKGCVAYAVAFVESPEKQAVELRAGCINGLKVFLNGKELFAREEYHHGMRIDQYAPRGTLEKGLNTILLKVCQNEQEENWAQDWRFQLRLTDGVGAAVPFTPAKAPAKEGR